MRILGTGDRATIMGPTSPYYEYYPTVTGWGQYPNERRVGVLYGFLFKGTLKGYYKGSMM